MSTDFKFGWGFDAFPGTTTPDFVFLVTKHPAPIILWFPIWILSIIVQLTPKKQLFPISTLPETTQWDDIKVLLFIFEWCPMWLPLHNMQLSSITTYGWITLFSKIKQFFPIFDELFIQFGCI